MLDLPAIEIWTISLALACALGWVIGSYRSAATGTVVADDGGEIDGLCTLTIRDSGPRAKPQAAAPAVFEQWATGGPNSNDRAALFADMPPLAELHARTDAIRLDGKVWDAPDLGDRIDEFLHAMDADSRETLSEYRASIEALAHTWGAYEPVRRCQPSLSSTRV